ncbi:MAG: enoyl-CoA hydratase/isomerase family protein [Acidobacteria bacterium]|nr:enoyl-CoA hydratase/isomerase family protein [Acidobacteriota bacterium]
MTASDDLNKLSWDRLHAWHRLWDELERASPQRVYVYSDRASIFAAGADIRELASFNEEQAAAYSACGQRLMDRIEGYRGQVTALVSGSCYGGALDLVLACHRILATRETLFCHPGVKLGIVTGFGGTVRLPEKVGASAANWMFVSGKPLNATDAWRLGLVAHVFETHADMVDWARAEPRN